MAMTIFKLQGVLLEPVPSANTVAVSSEEDDGYLSSLGYLQLINSNNHFTSDIKQNMLSSFCYLLQIHADVLTPLQQL